MSADCNLAIETSGRIGSVALGRGDRPRSVLLATADMPEQERHRVDLMPTIDRLCQAHGVGPRQIGEVYLSAGPGSFTGLRIGVATAKMLAQVLGAKIVAVPTVRVIASNVTPDGATGGLPASASPPPGVPRTLLVCLNLKRDTVYAGRFVWDRDGWSLAEEPRLWTAGELLALAGAGPTAIVGDPLPEAVRAAIPEAGGNSRPSPQPSPSEGRGSRAADASHLTILPAPVAQPHAEAVWHLGRAMAQRGAFVDPLALTPIYARQPEAVELWERRLATDGHR